LVTPPHEPMVADHNKVFKNKGRALLARPFLSPVPSKTEGVIIAHASDSGIIVQSQSAPTRRVRGTSLSLCRLGAVRHRENGWQKPYELRGSCTVL